MAMKDVIIFSKFICWSFIPVFDLYCLHLVARWHKTAGVMENIYLTLSNHNILLHTEW